MQLLKVLAKDIKLWDILGEGEEVWCRITSDDSYTKEVLVFFGGIGCWDRSRRFKEDDVVVVLRRPTAHFVNAEAYKKREVSDGSG